MDEEFEIGKELVVFPRHAMDGLRQLIDYYVDHDDEREQIRRCGFERCPTYDDRVAVLLSHINDVLEAKQS